MNTCTTPNVSRQNGIDCFPLISTRLQPGDVTPIKYVSRFSSFLHGGKPLKRLMPSSPTDTGLKPGANGRVKVKPGGAA